jgi:putative intracellular protease/amidase
MRRRSVLIVLSSCDRIPGTDRCTGSWLEELAAPYFVFTDAGAQVRLATPAGCAAPLDPTSEMEPHQTADTRRFMADPLARRALAQTEKLASLRPLDFDAAFFSGGLGPVFDLTVDPASIALIESLHRAKRPVAAVCHGLAAWFHVRDACGAPLVLGRAVTGFSRSEEISAELVPLVPFLIEDELRRLGAVYRSGRDGEALVTVDGTLVSGQNPASSAGTARAVLDLLRDGGQFTV